MVENKKENKNVEIFDSNQIYISVHKCNLIIEPQIDKEGDVEGKLFLTSNLLIFKYKGMPIVKVRRSYIDSF
jgi:hypothetical protein